VKPAVVLQQMNVLNAGKTPLESQILRLLKAKPYLRAYARTLTLMYSGKAYANLAAIDVQRAVEI